VPKAVNHILATNTHSPQYCQYPIPVSSKPEHTATASHMVTLFQVLLLPTRVTDSIRKHSWPKLCHSSTNVPLCKYACENTRVGVSGH